LGFVGWFKKWHGLDMLLELYAEEKWQEKNLHLLLVGDGPAMNELMNLAKDLGIGSGVTFTGPVNRTEIPLYISSFDIALQPRVNEYASPMKIFEYMAMGKCVIAPEQPNIGEILLDGVTALLFRPSDKDSMRAAISKALCSSELRNQLGGNARNTIFDRGYLWEKNAERALTYALEKNE
jgi:glycosyltransferase involved in cell wall biosynthesis